MAQGFFKKIFSFGRKQVEETAPDDAKASPEGLPRPEDAGTGSPDAPGPEAHAEAPGIEPVPEITRERVDEPEEKAPEAFAADGVFQPTPETAPAGIAPEATPEPAQPQPEPAPDVPAEPEPAPAPSPPEKPAPSEPEPQPAPPEEPKPSEPAPTPATPEEPRPDTAPDLPPEPTPEEIPAPAEPLPEPPREIPEPPSEVPPAAPPETPVEQSAMTERPSGKVLIGEEPAPVESAPAEEQPKSWFARLSTGLSRSSRQLSDNISGVFTKRPLDEDTLQDLEDVLIQADLGIETAMRITDTLSEGRYGKDVSSEDVRRIMADEVTKVLGPVALPLELDLSHRPHVILVVGVNGTGKTTTIGKLAAKLSDAGLSVTLAAGDTFRAAAIEQLKIWADRTRSTFVGTRIGADAAGLAWDAYEKAKANGSDVVIIDTAGRLQNKAELMDELAKIVRVLQKLDPEAPHTVLQTLDATTGQNALNQVEIFRNVAGVNGLVMTKLDGTARGGILVAISAKYKLPVYFIGIGEGVDDLEPFRASDFASAISGVSA